MKCLDHLCTVTSATPAIQSPHWRVGFTLPYNRTALLGFV